MELQFITYFTIFDIMKESVKIFLSITIGAFLLFVGNSLKERYSSADLELHYKLKYNEVNHIGYVDFNISNETEYAFDSLKILPDYKDIIISSYESDKHTNLSQLKNIWQSPILPNEKLEGIVVVKTQNIDISSFMENVEIKRKNPKTYNWEKIKIVNVDNKSFNLFKRQWFLFFAPYISFGVLIGLYYLCVFLIKKIKEKLRPTGR